MTKTTKRQKARIQKVCAEIKKSRELMGSAYYTMTILDDMEGLSIGKNNDGDEHMATIQADAKAIHDKLIALDELMDYIMEKINCK